MDLNDILEEISIGYNNTDSESEKLQKYVEELREALSKPGSIIESRTFNFDKVGTSIGQNNMFLQGSYATHTAIKYKGSEVDADIGIIIGDAGDYHIREQIYSSLKDSFPNYQVTKKKPCITVDFLDGYHIDVAVYSDEKETIYFHNSIPSGIERSDVADPKGLVSHFNDNLSSPTDKRKILRLFKYFNGIASVKYEIDKDNKIPSIALAIFISNATIKKIETEKDLHDVLLTVVNDFKDYVEKNGANGPSLSEYYIDNTFYKIKDISEVKKVLTNVSHQIQTKNYADLVSAELFEKVSAKKNINTTSSLVGTLG